jgi:hypothetical protein
MHAGKIVSVLEGGYGELKEQGGKWVFDREVSERTVSPYDNY